MPAPGGDAAAIAARKSSILDFVDRRFAALSPRLGMRDRQKIDQHLTKIREIEQGIMLPPTHHRVAKPPKVDTSAYNPRTGLNSSDTGAIVRYLDPCGHSASAYMMDMMVRPSLRHDGRRHDSMERHRGQAHLPVVDASRASTLLCSRRRLPPLESEKIFTWYSSMHLYLIQAMAAVDMGGHTLLDESVVFFGTELADRRRTRRRACPFCWPETAEASVRGGG